MYRKGLFWLLWTLFLTVLLAFTGCPTSSGGDTSSQQQQENGSGGTRPVIPRPVEIPVTSSTDVSDINNSLNSSSTGSVTLKSNSGPQTITTDAPLTVPSGKQLVIGEDVTLEIPNGQTAVINGPVSVAEDGVLDFSEIAPTGNDGAVTVSSALTVASGGTIYMPEPQTVSNAPQFTYGPNGKVVLQAGSTIYMHLNSADVKQIGPQDAAAPIYEWVGTNGSVELITNVITLKSGADLKCNGVNYGGGAITPLIQKAIVESGAAINLAFVESPQNTSLEVYISLEVNGALTAAGTIIGAATATPPTITFGSGATLSGAGLTTNSNFYESDGTTQITGDNLKGKTFTWDNSSSKWKESA